MENLEQLVKKIDRLETMIFGYEGPGLKDTVVRLDESVKQFDASIKDLAIVVSGLVKFVDESIGKDKIKTQMATTIRWLVGSLITVILALITLVLKVIL